MPKNQLTTTKNNSLVLGKAKSLMGITKKILDNKTTTIPTTQKAQDLVLHKDITIIGDLMWAKEADEMMEWDDAMKYAKNLRLGGYDDWRLPTIEELTEVVRLCGGEPARPDDKDFGEIIDRNVDNSRYQENYSDKAFSASNYYWSSTTYAGYSGNAWDVGFGNGYQGYSSKSGSYHVRCVRAGQ